MKLNCIIIRTHEMDDDTTRIISLLKHNTNYLIAVAADESRREIITPEGVYKFSITSSTVADFNLAAPSDFGWRCGDYGAYIVATKINADFYWIIEPDVLLNFSSVGGFFEFFKDKTEDLIAPALRDADDSWCWTSPIKQYGISRVSACLFPIVRLSRRAVNTLFQARIEISKTAIEKGFEIPNDEFFVASIIKGDPKLSCANLNELGQKFYHHELTFNTVIPFSRNFLINQPPDEMLYHPVRHGKRFRSSLIHLMNNFRSVDWSKFGQRILDHAAAELSRSELEAYQYQINALISGKYLLPAEHPVQTIGTGAIIRSRYDKDIYFFVMEKNEYIQTYHYRGLFYEETELCFISQMVPKGGVFVDVGAHTGNHTVFFGSIMNADEIIPIEPNERAFDALRVNISLNHLSNIINLSFCGFALAESERQSCICYSANNWGAGVLKDQPGPKDQFNRAKVVPGDALFAGKHIDFIKIDIGRALMSVLAGMQKTIHATRCTLMVTVPELSIQAFSQWRDSQGYTEIIRWPNYGEGYKCLLKYE